MNNQFFSQAKKLFKDQKDQDIDRWEINDGDQDSILSSDKVSESSLYIQSTPRILEGSKFDDKSKQ